MNATLPLPKSRSDDQLLSELIPKVRYQNQIGSQQSIWINVQVSSGIELTILRNLGGLYHGFENIVDSDE